jgi:hypothetical protein
LVVASPIEPVLPEITWFDTPVIVDNQAGGAIIKAA